MALQGSLSDSGFSDVLQFIAHQNKTGILHLKLEDYGAQVCFEEGKVAHAEYVGRETPDAFLAAVDCTPEQADEVVRQAAETGQSSAEILIEMGLLTSDDYTEIARLQITEILYELFSWRTGRYHFEPTDLSGFQFAIEPLSVESFMMEGYRRLDEWPRLRTRFTNLQAVYRVIKEPEEGLTGEQLLDAQMDAAFGDFGEEDGDFGGGLDNDLAKAAASALTENDLKIVRLCDGVRNIERVAGLSRLGLFETLSSLAHLLDGGYLELVSVQDLEVKGTGSKPLWMHIAASAAVFLVVGLYFVILPRSKAELAQNAQLVEAEQISHIKASHLQAIDAALQVYYLTHKQYPEKLGNLVEEGLLSSNALLLERNDDIFYASNGDAFMLERNEDIVYVTIGAGYDLR